MNIYALPAVLAFTANITFGLIVLLNNPKRLANRLFALFVFSFALWNAGEFLMIFNKEEAGVAWGVRIILTGIFMSPTFFLNFSLVFPRRIKSLLSQRHFTIAIYSIPALILLAAFLASGIDIRRIEPLGDICYYSFSFHKPWVSKSLVRLLLLLALTYYSLGIRNLFRSLRRSRLARERLQIKYLIFGIVMVFSIGFFIGLSNFLFTFGYPLFLLGGSYTILISLFFAVAIVKYRLLDIPFLIKRSVLYFCLSGLILAVYIFIVKNIGEAISRAYGISSIFVEGLVIVAIVLLLRPLETNIWRILDRLLYPEVFQYRHRFFNFTRDLLKYRELEDLSKIILDFLSSSLRVERVVFLLKDDSGDYKTIGAKGLRGKITLEGGCPLIDHLKQARAPLEWEGIGRVSGKGSILSKMGRMNTSMILPLFSEEDLIGMIILGRRINSRGYSQEEIETLNIFSNEVAIAISRAYAIQQMKTQERELMQAEKLAALGKLSAGVAHEIRNPLGIISGAAETLLKKNPDPKTHKEMLRFILDETNRLNQVITDFLRFARPKEPDPINCNLLNLIEKTLRAISQKAASQGVKIETYHCDGEIELSADPEQLKQALLNLELNALEAMPQGGVLRIQTQRGRDKTLLIKIQDTGPGIPEEVQSRIFDPFFTTKEGGTGLGLSIVHRIVEDHGGKIGLTTGPEGTTFTLVLPVK